MERPGKTKTWWHPMLASFLRWLLGEQYQVQEEVPVGTKPLQIDFLLLRKLQGELPAKSRRLLAGVAEYLNELTLVEFKSPSDTLRPGDFMTLLGYALLYQAQNDPTLDPSQLTLMLIAPRLTAPCREDMRRTGVTAQEKEAGIWRLQGGGMVGHPGWLLETEILSNKEHPVLTLLSPRFLRHGQEVYLELSEAGYTEVVVFMAQQVQQFKLQGRAFAMQHLGTDDEMLHVVRAFLATLPPEQLRQALPPEERVKGLPPEERIKGLPPEELERLRELLIAQTKQDTSATEPK